MSEIRRSSVTLHQSNETCLTTSLFSCQRHVCGTPQQSYHTRCREQTSHEMFNWFMNYILNGSIILSTNLPTVYSLVTWPPLSTDLLSNYSSKWKLAIYRPFTQEEKPLTPTNIWLLSALAMGKICIHSKFKWLCKSDELWWKHKTCVLFSAQCNNAASIKNWERIFPTLKKKKFSFMLMKWNSSTFYN